MDGAYVLEIPARPTICLGTALDGGPVKPGVIARVIARYRCEGLSVPVTPGFIGAMGMLSEYRRRLSIDPFARPTVPSLKDQDE